jgi:hypothetical protein
MANIVGGCLCGNMRYTLRGTPLSGLICHCLSCRRAAGAQSVAWLIFRSRDFSLICGEPTSYRSSDEVSRTFCGQCGTTLTYRNDWDPDLVFVTAASLDDPEEFPPTHHVWIEDGISWDVANDELPRFERGGSQD